MKPRKLKVAPLRPSAPITIDSLWPLPVSFECSVCSRVLLSPGPCPRRNCTGRGIPASLHRVACKCTRWTVTSASLYSRCRACHRRLVPCDPLYLDYLVSVARERARNPKTPGP